MMVGGGGLDGEADGGSEVAVVDGFGEGFDLLAFLSLLRLLHASLC